MACFLVPTAEAIVVTAAKKSIATKAAKDGDTAKAQRSLSLVHQLTWLTNLLWGGAVLLMFEHFWHGEIIPYFPFLSAVTERSTTQQMLFEMSTVGVGMAVLVTVVWGVGLAILRAADRRRATVTMK